jgi:type I restriction enzyme M protein
MAKTISTAAKDWYFDAIEKLGGAAITVDRTTELVTYNAAIESNESRVRSADPEELAHAVTIGLLHSKEYNYPLTALGHEIHFPHGSKGSKADEVDILVKDEDGLPYAIIELKAASEYDRGKEDAIKHQLFGTAPIVGAPKLLVYATVEPTGADPKIRAICIDYTTYKSYQAWQDAGAPHSTQIPWEYQDLGYEPYVNDGAKDLNLHSTHADFRALALLFHNEFFGEHADNTIFVNLVKCLLAKIHDERTCRKNKPYRFQVRYQNSKPNSAEKVFNTVNELYREAYSRYIDPVTTEIDEINPKEFSEERVKTVVLALEGVSITKGAARHGDIIGAFFEEILRAGFKQDRGMYFTHDNLVRFMIEAVDLAGLTRETWERSNHPDNRLPYVVDPACGSGTFLLHAMNAITNTVKASHATLVSDHDSIQFYNARLSDDQPNYWAENFVYGLDPKFIMAVTAKVNMVLHGDGSAHIHKDDAFRPLGQYRDARLRPCGETQRSVSRAQYACDLCEAFDLVVSNPPFGITIASDVREKLGTAFSLPESVPSEGLFLERCFQLLKPGGRLAVVLPESVLNAKEMSAVRLFFYRFFTVRAIVSMPRNIFIDTPTLTSLVFAQKKTASEVARWDKAWQGTAAEVEEKLKLAVKVLHKGNTAMKTAGEIAREYLAALDPVVTHTDWVLKGGKTPSVLRIAPVWSDVSGGEAANYYKELRKTSGFRALLDGYIFRSVAAQLDYAYPTFMVEEVGYKLSKRKEKARSNQLCVFRGKNSGRPAGNLHLVEEEYEVVVNETAPSTVLDYMRKQVSWQ